MSINRQKLVQELAHVSRRQSTYTVLMHYAIATKLKLNPADHKCLDYIIESKSVTAGELQKLTGLTSGAVTAMVDRLHKRGLVTRQTDEHDRRKIIITANTENLGAIEEVFRPVVSAWMAVLEGFTDEELAIILRYQVTLLEAQKEFTV